MKTQKKAQFTETKPVREAFTPTSKHQGSDGFVRTALRIGYGGDHGSVDVLSPQGVLLGRINLFLSRDADEGTLSFMVDVIDVDGAYPTRRMLTFSPTGGRTMVDVPSDGNLVASHFERPLTEAEKNPDPCPLCGEDRNHSSQPVTGHVCNR